MQGISVNDVLQIVSSFSLEEQYVISDTISKRIHDLKRSQIFSRVRQAQENYNSGNVFVGTAKDLIRAIDND